MTSESVDACRAKGCGYPGCGGGLTLFADGVRANERPLRATHHVPVTRSTSAIGRSAGTTALTVVAPMPAKDR